MTEFGANIGIDAKIIIQQKLTFSLNMPTKQNRLQQMYLQTSMKTSSLNSTEIRATILRKKNKIKHRSYTKA